MLSTDGSYNKAAQFNASLRYDYDKLHIATLLTPPRDSFKHCAALYTVFVKIMPATLPTATTRLIIYATKVTSFVFSIGPSTFGLLSSRDHTEPSQDKVKSHGSLDTSAEGYTCIPRCRTHHLSRM